MGIIVIKIIAKACSTHNYYIKIQTTTFVSAYNKEKVAPVGSGWRLESMVRVVIHRVTARWLVYYETALFSLHNSSPVLLAWYFWNHIWHFRFYFTRLFVIFFFCFSLNSASVAVDKIYFILTRLYVRFLKEYYSQISII